MTRRAQPLNVRTHPSSEFIKLDGRGTLLAMQRYELIDGTSSKFWEIEQTGGRLVVRWGRIGGNGHNEKVYELASPDAATKKHDKLVAEKTGKGYVLAGKPKVTRTKQIAAKGRTHDVSGEPAMTVDLAKLEKHLGLSVGPVLRELVTLCEATRPDDPAEAFGPLGAERALRFDIFHHPHAKLAFTKQPKGVRAIASDRKNTFGLYATGATSSDDAPVTFEDAVGVEPPTVIAANLATWLSQLACGGGADDDADRKRLRKNLQQHGAVSKALARAEVPAALALLDLDATKPPVTAAKPKPGKLSKADAAKATKLYAKADMMRYEKSAKAAALVARQALDLVVHAPYSDENPREAIELGLLDMLVEAKQTREAATLWASIVAGWLAAGVGRQGWYDLAKAQRALKLRFRDITTRGRARRAWAEGRLLNIMDGRELDAAGKLVRDSVTLYRAGDAVKAEATFVKALGAAGKAKRFEYWEALAALYVLLGRAGREERTKILQGWKAFDAEAPTSIFES